MRFIDAHHHLWDLGKHRYTWHEESRSAEAAGRSTYLAEDYLADAGQHRLWRSVHVEGNFDPSGRRGCLAAADSRRARVPHGIVGYAALHQPGAGLATVTTQAAIEWAMLPQGVHPHRWETAAGRGPHDAEDGAAAQQPRVDKRAAVVQVDGLRDAAPLEGGTERRRHPDYVVVIGPPGAHHRAGVIVPPVGHCVLSRRTRRYSTW